jgi:hypothetical protein
MGVHYFFEGAGTGTAAGGVALLTGAVVGIAAAPAAAGVDAGGGAAEAGAAGVTGVAGSLGAAAVGVAFGST